ncbi:MAG: bacteriohemerythrin [Bacteroidota bacterium]
MKAFTWSDDLTVGDPELDRHHRSIVDAIGRMEQALEKNQKNTVTGMILFELQQYVEIHFAAEEKLFRKTGFPKAESHLAEHRVFQEKLEVLKEKFDSGDGSSSLDVMDFLIDWLTNHILTFDREYIPYIGLSK